MPKPRNQQVGLEATPYYHCISRCVRRAFLCGDDRLTGKCFDHRKPWLVERLKELSAIFAIDICAFAVMANHFHLVLHIDQTRALGWSDAEVSERYEKLFRHTVKEARELPERALAKKVSQWRKRLWDLSWFMRCLNESIARRANREDHCTGRFWEGRFRSQALLDEGALLTCMSYVDLNPIRANMATTLEDSEFTSIQERLRAAAQGEGATKTQLVPFKDQATREDHRLAMPFDDYVELLRWTAASIPTAGERAGERVPEAIGRTLEGLTLNSQGFLATICTYARSFFTMVGQAHRIEVESQRRGYRRRPGLPAAERMYRERAA